MLKMWKENINFKSCEQREGGERFTFIFILFRITEQKIFLTAPCYISKCTFTQQMVRKKKIL